MDHASVRQAIAGLPELAGWPVSGADPVARSAARDALSQRLPPVLWPFCRAVLQAMAEAGVVLLLDEFSVFLRTSLHEDKLGTESLLKVLKELRHRNPPLRMAVAGSTGLSAFVLFHGLSDELSDLPGTELPALSLADGRTLAEELLYGMDLLPSERVIDAILECIGEPVPYFVHALADAVREETPPGDQPTPERVRMAYGERVVGPLGSYLFRGYRLSTHPYPPEVLAPAARLLRRLARSDQPLPAAELRREYELSAAAHLAGRFDALLACLQEDYDLEQGEGTWRMRSKVLRDRFRLAAPFGGEE
jgi:hypothetical protein